MKLSKVRCCTRLQTAHALQALQSALQSLLFLASAGNRLAEIRMAERHIEHDIADAATDGADWFVCASSGMGAVAHCSRFASASRG